MGLSRGWDAYDGYLFDIDGTLLNCKDAVHYFAFCEALSAVAGRELNLDGVVTHGNTDEGILRDAFARGGVSDAVWRGRIEEIRDQMGAQVERHREEFAIEVLPGVVPMLEHLTEIGRVLSTATGNLARVGEAKLRRCDLRRYFELSGWSDGCESRAEVFRRALSGMRQRLGPTASVCVVGDTPADVKAAHASGLEVIAVATGIFPLEALKAEGAELAVRSLAELPLLAPAERA